MNTLHSCKITRFFVFVVCSTISSIAQSYQKFSPALDIYLDGLPHRRFHNVSLGIDPDENIGHHCNISNNESTGRKDMKFTPNRRLQEETISDAVEGSLQLGGSFNEKFFLTMPVKPRFCFQWYWLLEVTMAIMVTITTVPKAA